METIVVARQYFEAWNRHDFRRDRRHLRRPKAGRTAIPTPPKGLWIRL